VSATIVSQTNFVEWSSTQTNDRSRLPDRNLRKGMFLKRTSTPDVRRPHLVTSRSNHHGIDTKCNEQVGKKPRDYRKRLSFVAVIKRYYYSASAATVTVCSCCCWRSAVVQFVIFDQKVTNFVNMVKVRP
jgi:hypothetical protein